MRAQCRWVPQVQALSRLTWLMVGVTQREEGDSLAC